MLYREFLHCTVDRKEGGRDWGPGIICSDAAPGTYASRSVGLLKFLGTAKAAPPAAVALLNTSSVEDILGSYQDCVFRAYHELPALEHLPQDSRAMAHWAWVVLGQELSTAAC